MMIDEQLLGRIESLRIPLDNYSSPIDWKDWYHYVLIDLEKKLRVLVNITFIGRPEQGEVQTTFIANIPLQYCPSQIQVDVPVVTFGTTFSQAWRKNMLQSMPLNLQGKQIKLEIQGNQSIIEVQDDRAQLSINFFGEAQATPLLVTEDSIFGSGFIGWGLVPGLKVSGELSICQQKYNIDNTWFCYHDRNFGRFRWGEDIGWEWFVGFFNSDDGRTFTLVLDRRTNKDHSFRGFPYIFIYEGKNLRKIFLGQTLQINWEWTSSPLAPLRLPGIMATLFSERTLKMPQALEVRAADEQDKMSLTIKFDASIELIVPDNQARQYSFIEEVTGIGEINFSFGGEIINAKGLVYAEYVL